MPKRSSRRLVFCSYASSESGLLPSACKNVVPTSKSLKSMEPRWMLCLAICSAPGTRLVRRTCISALTGFNTLTAGRPAIAAVFSSCKLMAWISLNPEPMRYSRNSSSFLLTATALEKSIPAFVFVSMFSYPCTLATSSIRSISSTRSVRKAGGIAFRSRCVTD